MEEVITVGKIYKLISKNTNKVYYGSTTFVFLSIRLLNHERCYRDYKLGKRGYQSSYDSILECGDYKIELVEDVVGTNKKDLLARERYYIENNECVNRVVPLGKTIGRPLGKTIGRTLGKTLVKP
jgi:hypothetical protein